MKIDYFYIHDIVFAISINICVLSLILGIIFKTKKIKIIYFVIFFLFLIQSFMIYQINHDAIDKLDQCVKSFYQINLNDKELRKIARTCDNNLYKIDGYELFYQKENDKITFYNKEKEVYKPLEGFGWS